MSRSKTLKLGTRKSLLALTQSAWVGKCIESRWPDVSVELVHIVTKGDKIQDVALAKVGGKGLFVKEIEDALLRRDVDFAVHSLKDVPAELPPGLEVAIFPEREDPRDALISRDGFLLKDLPPQARIGTSSLRRMMQLRAVRPDFDIQMLRGNLDTRLRKLEEGAFDAIILAAAGLRRLGLEAKITQYLDADVMLPAVGQGCLGIECRSDDQEVKDLLMALHDEATALCVRAERAFLARLEGGCQVPIGAFAQGGKDGALHLEGLVGNETGTTILRRAQEGSTQDPESLGQALADEILAAGGREILKDLYGTV